jgi:drug/metabolite transporter (DMT)-like permease
MHPLAVVMVLASSLSHAWWNLLAKQARDKLIFCWLIYVTASILLAPLAVWGALREPIRPAMWLCALGTSTFFTLYAISLARAYRHGDVSLVYPIVRSTGPLLTVLFAALFLHERLQPFGYLGIALIVAGAAGVSWPEADSDGQRRSVFQRLQWSAVSPAVLTGATIAVFSVIDKVGVTLANPVFYNFILFCATSVWLTPIVMRRRSWEDVRASWAQDSRAIWLSGAFNAFGYLLILYAFRLAPASYVIALRSTAVVFAVILGSQVLGEKRGFSRAMFGVLIVAGLALVYLKG